jgi:hypothetical protein
VVARKSKAVAGLLISCWGFFLSLLPRAVTASGGMYRMGPLVCRVQRDLPHSCNISTSCQLFALFVRGRHNSAGRPTAVVTSAAVCQLCPSLESQSTKHMAIVKLIQEGKIACCIYRKWLFFLRNAYATESKVWSELATHLVMQCLRSPISIFCAFRGLASALFFHPINDLISAAFDRASKLPGGVSF